MFDFFTSTDHASPYSQATIRLDTYVLVCISSFCEPTISSVLLMSILLICSIKLICSAAALFIFSQRLNSNRGKTWIGKLYDELPSHEARLDKCVYFGKNCKINEYTHKIDR